MSAGTTRRSTLLGALVAPLPFASTAAAETDAAFFAKAEEALAELRRSQATIERVNACTSIEEEELIEDERAARGEALNLALEEFRQVPAITLAAFVLKARVAVAVAIHNADHLQATYGGQEAFGPGVLEELAALLGQPPL